MRSKLQKNNWRPNLPIIHRPCCRLYSSKNQEPVRFRANRRTTSLTGFRKQDVHHHYSFRKDSVAAKASCIAGNEAKLCTQQRQRKQKNQRHSRHLRSPLAFWHHITTTQETAFLHLPKRANNKDNTRLHKRRLQKSLSRNRSKRTRNLESACRAKTVLISKFFKKKEGFAGEVANSPYITIYDLL